MRRFHLTSTILFLFLLATSLTSSASAETLPQISGVYPHLAYYNHQGECGTGAVVPWADRLWVITYGPHLPGGSDDKLYEITPDLAMTIRPESIGGTPANRMIHRESGQLFIGPYAIDDEGKVRAIPYSKMYGRHTGCARHLTDPTGKIYYATMEEGFYEVDVETLEVKEYYRDTNHRSEAPDAGLPGYHGKGLYSGQGRVIYANNGEHSSLARKRPDIPSGCLAEWNGKDWTVVRRNQFTEVTGPGGIYGNENPATDPIWSIGWDHRSLILMCLDGGKWRTYRLPKASHCYDGAHGWNTEWPRIRDIGEDDLLMTMHGMFWRFPRTFSGSNATGIRPRATYLKVIGDFCRWNDQLVFGCDDSAKSEFLNKRFTKNPHAAPGQSHSNLWFTDTDVFDRLGPAIGRGAVWFGDDVAEGETSDPFLFAGFDRRVLHLVHEGDEELAITLEVDRKGDDKWEAVRRVVLAPKSSGGVVFEKDQPGEWIRLRAENAGQRVTAMFQYASDDDRSTTNDPIFAAIAPAGCPVSKAAVLWSLGDNRGVLGVSAFDITGDKVFEYGYYELDKTLSLVKKDDAAMLARVKKAAPPADVFTVDAASVVCKDSLTGRQFRLPKGNPALKQPGPAGWARMDREVVTERDLINCAGTFYECPANNADGLAKIRPVATHNLDIYDYCSWRGLLVLSGIDRTKLDGDDPHVVVSDDGKAAVWLGVIDDLWKLGKPVGKGGPWLDTKVTAGEPSDPYLMTGYDNKLISLSHKSTEPVAMTVQIDLTGTGVWVDYHRFEVPKGETHTHRFPKGFNAYWVRVVSDADTTATAQLVYE